MKTLALVWLVAVGVLCVMAAVTDSRRTGAPALAVAGVVTVVAAVTLWDGAL